MYFTQIYIDTSYILLYNILCMFLGFDTSENLFSLYLCFNVFLKLVTNIKTLAIGVWIILQLAA